MTRAAKSAGSSTHGKWPAPFWTTHRPSPKRSAIRRPVADADGLSVCLRVGDGYFHLNGLDASPDRGLVHQTAEIMKAVEKVFAEMGLSFRDVRKATTYYVASSSADALHDNMSIRNRYYVKPGPASTGLPVEGLMARGAQISISMFGVVPHHGR